MLEGYEINADYLYNELKKYIKPWHKVAVVAFSFRDTEVKSPPEWKNLYGKESGIYYNGIVGGFTAYGIIMGYSAGAVIQLSEYHLSPDKDYPQFNYYEGLSYLSGFYLEVHYEGTETQNDAIRRVLKERGKTVYATAFKKGALLVDNGKTKLLGDVRIFKA